MNPPHVLWYRKDLFEEKGLDVPKTWSEWLHAAKELTIDTDGDGKPDIYGMLQYLYDTEPQAITNLMYTSGASTFDENGNVAINSPAMKASVDFLKEIWKSTPSPARLVRPRTTPASSSWPGMAR
ncbi:MAG: ABC transporter substrate-binding protein [Limnochordia bacterium]